MKTPVVLIIFKRADTTKIVCEEIRKANPSKLFIIADGPRTDKASESKKCIEARRVVEEINWDCEVFRNYSDTNMGLRNRIASGLDWVFSIVNSAIILEDDCLPDPTFFCFCDKILEIYEHDERVMSVTGTNILGEWKSDLQSYHYSNYFNSWGWATWKRVWDSYDVDMKLWSDPEVKSRVRDVIADKKQYLNRKRLFDLTHSGNTQSWAYQFFFMCLINSGLTITPSVNLVSNIGFSQDATNTKFASSYLSAKPSLSMKFPLKKPLATAVDKEYDFRWYKQVWERSLGKRLEWKYHGLRKRLRI
ncbi:MAG: glycosyltransferase family 2 protein [Thermosynechococcaceae cyanobacterium]